MRSSDIRVLKLTDIQRERNTIDFTQFKTGAFNQVPLLENIKYAQIKNSRSVCDSERVFVRIKNIHQMINDSQAFSHLLTPCILTLLSH